jgi:UDP:flavonoid glycosyltransferase YjiC (YdhE family)
MVFHDVTREDDFDLWIGDEAWEVDYYLHENPELKTAPFAWLTDFVGYLPLAEGGEREAFLAADLNAEMIEQVERFPRVRDRSIFVGDAVDVVPATFGPGLPAIRDWTAREFAFSGYVLGFDAAALPSRDELRAELGWAPDEPVCVISVGGSGAGEQLLFRVCGALPELRERIPGLRLVAVAGPRIPAESLPSGEGLEVHAYVHELHRLFAACDVAIAQGGLTTSMELVALHRPFVSVPLARHFEQQLHVRHRLDRHGASMRLDYEDATPEHLADLVAAALASKPAYVAVPADGAARAAKLIAELL